SPDGPRYMHSRKRRQGGRVLNWGYVMRLFRCLVISAALVLGAAGARAEAPADPLQLIPDKADLFFKVEKPAKAIDLALHMGPIQELYKLDQVREFFESANYRRFYQLVAYFEKQLGAKWPELVDKLAGGGIVVALKTGSNPAATLIVVQARDEKLLDK